MSKELAEFVLQKLRNSWVEVILSSRVVSATEDSIKLNDDTIIPTKTIDTKRFLIPIDFSKSLHHRIALQVFGT
jgi:hypothetical protein